MVLLLWTVLNNITKEGIGINAIPSLAQIKEKKFGYNRCTK